MTLNARQRKQVASGRITDAAEVMTEQTLHLIKHILLKHETAQLEVMAEMKEEIERLKDELAYCIREMRRAQDVMLREVGVGFIDPALLAKYEGGK